MAEVTVTIGGKPYRLACGEGEEPHLLHLSREIDQRMEQLKGGFGEIGDMRLLLMAALTIADELSETRDQLEHLESDVAGLKDARAVISKRLHAAQEQIAETIEKSAERVEQMCNRLSEASGSGDAGSAQ